MMTSKLTELKDKLKSIKNQEKELSEQIILEQYKLVSASKYLKINSIIVKIKQIGPLDGKSILLKFNSAIKISRDDIQFIPKCNSSARVNLSSITFVTEEEIRSEIMRKVQEHIKGS